MLTVMLDLTTAAIVKQYAQEATQEAQERAFEGGDIAAVLQEVKARLAALEYVLSHDPRGQQARQVRAAIRALDYV